MSRRKLVAYASSNEVLRVSCDPVSSEERSRKLVVAGMIVAKGRILLTQRKASQAMPHKWEFPGGKIEEGEVPEEALRRELSEEIGVEVEVGRVYEVLSHAYPDFDLLMLVYPCRLLGRGQPTCRDVADLRWFAPKEMKGLDILEADKPLLERLLLEGVPAAPQHLEI